MRSAEWQEPVFEAAKTFEKGGAKAAVIGQAFPPHPHLQPPRWMIPDWEFGIREEDMQKQVDAARAGGAVRWWCSPTTASTWTARWRPASPAST